MATEATSDSSPDTDREFDPTADMLVHEFDDEQTLEEEEAMSNESAGNELDDLEKEGEMPLDELLAMYGYGGTGPPNPSSEPLQESRSSSEEEILSNQDLTLDKDEIARDLHFLKDEENEDSASVNDLMDSVNLKSNTARLLRSHDQAGSDEEDESADEDYQPQKDEDWKKTINVGSDFQAVVPPGLSTYGDAPAYENEDRLLWDPTKLESPNVEEFLKEVHKQLSTGAQGVHAIPTGLHIRDDEQALYLLLQCGHNVEEAIRRRKMQAVPPTDPMSLWSEEECRNFETGLRLYGKDFYLIQQNKVRTRSVGELVQFYYLWKKTERHDVFANKNRLEKKKYALHPGVTDYMERFLDDHENPSLIRPDRPASPTNSLLYADPKRHHDHPVANSDEANKPASPEEVAEAMELVNKVVDTNAIFSPIKNSVMDFTNAIQQASTTSSTDLPGYVTAATAPCAAPTATVSINPELKEGRSAENIVHIANVDTIPPHNAASPGLASSPSQNTSSNNSNSLPRSSSSPAIDSSNMNGTDQPSAKRMKTSHGTTDEALSISCDSESVLTTKNTNLSPQPRSPNKSAANLRVKGHNDLENSDSNSHLAGNVKLALSSNIVDKSMNAHTLSPEAAVRQTESLAQ